MRNFLLGGVAALALVGAVSFLTSPSGTFAASSDTYRQLNLFGDVFERVRADYVDPVKDDQLVESAVNGMLAGLDPHSSYMNPKSFRDMQVTTRGEFGGLGIEVTMENGLVKVVAPIDDTPAAKAGLRAGDLISQIDGAQIQGLTLSEAVDKMRGPVNSKIKLTILREGQEPFDVELARAQIKVQAVRSRREGDVGYVRITSFNEQTDVGLKKAVEQLKAEIGPSKVKGWVIDLRNNPGGLLDQAIAVSNDFLEKGEIVSTRGRRAEDAQRYNAKGPDIVDGKPVVVLINGGSASASEIVAGALQDHKRASILGTKSFGKGSVQTIIPLQGQGALRLTTARYYTPSGRSIQAKGIDPDYIVRQGVDDGQTIAKRPSEADLPKHLGGQRDDDQAERGDDNSPREAGPIPTDLKSDPQLQQAINLLNGIAPVTAQAAPATPAAPKAN